MLTELSTNHFEQLNKNKIIIFRDDPLILFIYGNIDNDADLKRNEMISKLQLLKPNIRSLILIVDPSCLQLTKHHYYLLVLIYSIWYDLNHHHLYVLDKQLLQV